MVVAPRKLTATPSIHLRWLAVCFACSILLLQLIWPTLTNSLWTAADLGSHAIPLRYFYASGLTFGRVDLWCPQLFAGYYLHGEGQVGMFHPFHLFIYRFLPFPQAFGIELTFAYVSLFAGAFLLFRQWKVEPSCAAFGAFTFSFSGHNLLSIIHINQIEVVAHACWAMLAIHFCMRGQGRLRVLALLGLALANGSALLDGYPFYFLLTMVLQIWYFVYLVTVERTTLGMSAVGAGWLLGVLLGGVQILPTWSVLTHSSRAAPDLSFLAIGSLHPANVLQWINPYLFRAGKIGGGAGLNELGIYAGAGTVLLFVWLMTRRDAPQKRLIWFLFGLAALGVFLALGKYNPWYRSYAQLPVMGFFRVPARYFLLTHFALSAGAALAFDRLVTTPGSVLRQPGALVILIGMSATVATVGAKVVASTKGYAVAQYFAPLERVTIGCVLVCTVMISFYWMLQHGGKATLWFWCLSLLDVTQYSATYLAGLSSGTMAYYAGSRPPVPPPGPIASDQNALLVDGYTLSSGYVGLPPVSSLPVDQDPSYWRLLGVRAIYENGSWRPAPSGPVPMLRLARPLVAVSALERLTHMDGADTAVVASNIEVDEQVQGTVRIIEERPGFLRAEVASSGRVLCVFKQRLFPGWRADTERGQLQIIPVDGDFIGFVVPGGRNQVTLHFDPADFRIGRNLTLLASAVLIAGAVAVSAKRAWQ